MLTVCCTPYAQRRLIFMCCVSLFFVVAAVQFASFQFIFVTFSMYAWCTQYTQFHNKWGLAIILFVCRKRWESLNVRFIIELELATNALNFDFKNHFEFCKYCERRQIFTFWFTGVHFCSLHFIEWKDVDCVCVCVLQHLQFAICNIHIHNHYNYPQS